MCKMASRIHYDISRKNYKLTVILRSEASSGSYQLLNNTLNWSDSEHTQSLQICNDERFRMTIFFIRSVNGLHSKPCTANCVRRICFCCAMNCSMLYTAKSLIFCGSAPRSSQSLAGQGI